MVGSVEQRTRRGVRKGTH